MQSPAGEHLSGAIKPLRLCAVDFALMAMLSLCAIAVLGKDISRGGLADADSSAHLMDGVLIHDWVRAGPSQWLHPIEFAEQQYAHYPTLGLGQHYPPGFAIVEAAFFAVFGISTVTGRLCVAFFGVLLIIGTYLLARTFTERTTAAVAAIVMLTMPATTLWGRQTMLEIPTLAVMVLSSLCFFHYLRAPSWRRLGVALLAAALCISFKQTAIALPGMVVLTLVVLTALGIVPLRHALASAAVGLSILAIVVISLDVASAKTLSGYDSFPHRLGLHAIFYYPSILRYQTGTALLAAAVMGALICIRTSRAPAVFLVSWFATMYVLANAVSLKVPRFFYVGLFPIAIFAAIGLMSLARRVPWLALRQSIVVAASLLLLFLGMRQSVTHSPEFAHVVRAHADALDGQTVLFSGLRDGDFVFAVREQLGWRRGIVIRGSKLLYTCTAGPDLDLISYAPTLDAVTAVMREFAFETVIIERENRVGTKEDQFLRKYLAEGGDYMRIAEHRLQDQCAADCAAPMVDVYRLARPIERQVDHFDIPMPRTQRPIRVDLRKMALNANEHT